MQRYAIAFFLGFLAISLQAQVSSNLRVKTIRVKSDTTILDTLAIADFKILSPTTFDSTKYTVDFFHATLITSYSGTITISYRVIFYPFLSMYNHKDKKIIRDRAGDKGNNFVYIPQQNQNVEDDEIGLNKSGVISRGITVGNNQDLVLNSIFNLQLSGRLNSEWNVLGSISDDNTQLQPDGSTLQLQEFDKIFIKLYNQNTQVTVGDFELKPDVSQSYFMNYYKRNRGVYVTSREVIDSSTTLKYGGSAGAAKGRYARQVVAVNDGNQGPYRLKGNNGEQYVLINAGSERIYLDDKLLLRGYDNDYIVDYNTGEISFTAKRLITAASRVVAEFQYTDRNYSRVVLNGFAEWQQKNLNIRLHYYSEKDLKNQPVLLDLTDAEKQKLASVGDSVNKAFSSSAKEVKLFTTDKILYRKVDTLGYLGVFVLANGNTNDTIYYEISFNDVGAGKGNYHLIKSDVNGKVYQFIPPLGSVLQGDAEPLLPLTAPQGLQNISLGADYLLNKHENISVEIAGSNFDRNEFSKLDKADDKGFAIHTKWNQNFALSKKDKPIELSTSAMFDYINKDYKSIERFRDVNFSRLWNRQLQQVNESTTQAMEYNTKFNIQLKKTSEKTFNIGAQQYTRDKEQDGLLYNSSLNIKHKNTTVNASGEIMQNQLILLNTRNNSTLWSVFLMQQLKKELAIGTEAKQEQSKFKLNTNDSLLIQSFAYTQGLVFMKWQKKSSQFRIDASRRNDASPLGEKYVQSYSTNILAANSLIQLKNQGFQVQAQYKTIEVHNTALTTLGNDATLAFQLQHTLQGFKNAIQHNLQCNAGSGQEQRRIYTFIEVPAGRGTYAWRDYNNDGIKQLNEFEQAYNPDEAKYVRVLIPTLDFTKVNYFSLYETMVLEPYKIWKGITGVRGFLSKFQNNLTYKNELKQYATNNFFVTSFSPKDNDTTLISNISYIENNIIFNRPFNKFEMRYNYRSTGTTSLLTYGIDSRKKIDHGVVIRFTFSSISFIQLFLQEGLNQLHSQYFASRDYRFNYYSVEPKINFEIQRTLRLTLRTKYYIAQEELIRNAKTVNIESGMDLHWYLSAKSFMDSRMSLVNIKFDGDVNSTAAYEMLQGLSNGNNILIYLTFLHQISSSMQINFNYNGRSAQGKPMIHTGGVEVRYLF
jgi:hypothetical protein